jgi:kinesin family protein 5
MQETVEEELGEAPAREGPKLLAVSAPTRVVMFQPGAGIRPFVFARVFDQEASQEDVYENTARSSVCAALNGFNSCLLCYGQTGAGKTHTMFGQSVACGGNAGAVVSQHSGSVMRALRDLFSAAAELEQSCDVVTQMSAQYVQIYQDQVTCLMSGNAVSLREAVAGAPVLLQGASEICLESLVDASLMIANGEERKRYAQTAMNHRSSRAHTVLAVKVTQRRGDLDVSSQLHLVDLAGSERVKKSRAQGGRLVEAVGINTSLMVLGQCIAARVEDRPHVPYYESRLTLLLRSALGGNSRTNVVVCCHKADKHADETLQALSFGERCAMVSNRVHAAIASSASEAAAAIDAALAECSQQIQGLEARGKGHLPACDKLRKRHGTLARRRRELADRVRASGVQAAEAATSASPE